MAQVTLSDVARIAGVSLATTSRVLNGSSRVPGKAISQRVMQAAEKLGYVPNASAQALARSSSGLLGVVIQDLEDPYFSAVAAGFQEAAGGQGQLVLMAQTSRDADLTIVALGGLNAQRVDGVLMVGSLDLSAEQRAVFSDQLARVEARGGQVVTVGQSYGIGRTVYPADRDGGRAIGQAAIAGGYQRFALLDDVTRAPSAVDRAAGFAAAIEESGGRIEYHVPAPVTAAGGRVAGDALVRHLEEHPGGPMCFFAMTDAVAVAAMGRALHAGIRVPDELGVVGFDGIAAGRDIAPSLTTFDLPLRDIGRRAFELIHHPEDADLPETWEVREDTITIPGRLWQGGSTSPPPT